ncbi:putative RNA polymerase sigma factor FecI [Pseudomonas reidholzensis]|uniref:Putative RNA polymerase sigma factor FecI n=1 Tax=Pseudomonas reidholzensis TaxID=1785162 RepID=A0A383RZD2_9PSED|nr:sigma-70 family RNA polymerase sigma factor [Pseudomonas reidholzensis]SYX91826.1 putative RNA polymerase sigma factor FecI [Pseudomonas reidholzensis]
MDVDHKSRSLLIDRWFRSEYRWLRTRVVKDVGCPHSAEDIAAETFAQLLTLRDLLSVRAPRALLGTIARRLMYEGWRRRDLEKAYRESLANQEEGYHPSPEEQALVIEALLTVDRLLDGLSSKAKTAFLLHQLDGLTYAEIAAELAVSPSRVQQYMVQAFKHIYQATTHP